MRIPLRARVSLFATLFIVCFSAFSTLLFTSYLRATAEKEIVARGLALGQSLARAAAEGLAAEDLNLLGKAADIVRAEDVLFAQVFSSIWSPIEAYPFEQMYEAPAAEAIEHFRTSSAPFLQKSETRYDFYAPVLLRIPQAPETAIGYARLALSTAALKESLRAVVLGSILIAAAITLLIILASHLLLGRLIVSPILRLHRAVGLVRDGKVAEEVEIPEAADEIADLAREFGAMSLALREREARLSEEKERLAVTLRSIGDGVIVTDADGQITMVNRVAEELTGWKTEEASGRPFCEVFAIHHEKSREPCANIVGRVLASGAVVSLANHTALRRKDGREIIIEDAAAPIRDRESQIIGVVLVFRDITEKRWMEEEVLRAEKLQALGVLAGGIAHDFNNLLTGILGNVSVARLGLDPGDRVQVRLAEAEAACRRAADLTAQLLTFSRGGAPVKRAADLGDILRESARFILSGTNVAAQFKVAHDALPVQIDTGQMSQVFNNLTLNAVHAMPGGGTIRYAVENVVLTAGEIPTLPPGKYLRIEVQDEGTGIAEEHLGQIFDPYFTTKHDGVGLGLASVYSIVRKHDGHIGVTSRRGQGTTFRIHLPAADGAPPAEAAEEKPLATGQGAVLVMDDEQVVRDVAAEMLRTLGFGAVTAGNGTEALALYREALARGEPFRAVIMDLTVPGGMGGKAAIAELLAIDPQARVIVSSGYSNDPVLADHRAFGFRGIIVKPYTAKDFGRTLHEVLALE